jgi:hypothetical protein
LPWSRAVLRRLDTEKLGTILLCTNAESQWLIDQEY